MVHTGNAPSSVRSGSDHPIPNGRFGRAGGFREPDGRHMDDSSADTAKVRDDLGTGDRLAMVVQKAVRRMKESSLAEKLILAFMVAILSLLIHLNREVGEGIATWEAHIRDHPNVELGRRIDRHEEQMH